jgi:outer membrane protein
MSCLKGTVFALGLILCLGFAVPARGDGVKLGYFDMRAVLSNSKWGQQARDEYKRRQDALKNGVEQSTGELQILRDDYEKKSSLMDEAAKVKKLKEIQEKRAQSEKAVMEASQQLKELNSKLETPIFQKVTEIVRRIGKDEKYDFILEVQSGGLVYSPEKGDLTKRIIEEMDKLPIPPPSAQ